MSNKVVSYSVTFGHNVQAQDSLGNTCVTSDPCEMLDFLISSCTTRVAASAHRLFWELDRGVNAIISLLPAKVVNSLKSSEHKAFYNSFKLFYIPGKIFVISKCGEKASFFDLSQYFPEDPEPNDVQELQKNAELLIAMLSEVGIHSPPKLTSPIAIARTSGLFDPNAGIIPTIFDAPPEQWEAYELALKCTPHEWVCNYQIGYFDNLFCADIASAYPSSASNLLDLRDCSLIKSDVMDEGAYNGIVVGDFTVNPDAQYAFCSPFLADRGDGVLVNFVGTRENYACLLSEVRTLYRCNMGEFHLKYGWFIRPNKSRYSRMPFHKMMSQFYKARSQSATASFFFKRIMVGIIGKLLETRKNPDDTVKEYGELYNPLYHSIITSDTRLKVFAFLVGHNITKEELVHIGVDGIKITRHISLPTQVYMGQWRSIGSQPTIVLSPGAIINTTRRFKGISYSEIIEEINKCPHALKYGDIDLRRIDKKQIREFPNLPSTGQDLINESYFSNPLVL
jgi:hypothetical protein